MSCPDFTVYCALYPRRERQSFTAQPDKKLPKEFLEIGVPTQDDGVTSSAGFLKGLITLHESAIVLQE